MIIFNAEILRRWIPWTLAAAGFSFDLAAFWPGQMSVDSAYAWWQVRGGETSDITSPLMIEVWRVLDGFIPGPGALFTLHLLLFWSGLALLSTALQLGAARALLLMLCAGFAPLVLVLRAHVWTDVGLMSALLFSSAALAMLMRTKRRIWLLPALVLLLYAMGLRHNALPAVLPFSACTVWLTLRHYFQYPKTAVLAGTFILTVLMGLAVHVVNRRVDKHIPIWPALAEWDLAAISIGSNQMLLPPFTVAPEMGVADLASVYQPWSNIPLFTQTQHGIRDPLADDWQPEELNTLRRIWLKSIVEHFQTYLSHRIQVTLALFGTHSRDWYRELIYVDAETAVKDNPVILANQSGLHQALMKLADKWRDTAMLAAWPYLLLGLIALPFAWLRRAHNENQCALIILISGFCYALPLPFLAPAAETRYLGWSCLAAIIGFVLILHRKAPVRAAFDTHDKLINTHSHR